MVQISVRSLLLSKGNLSNLDLHGFVSAVHEQARVTGDDILVLFGSVEGASDIGTLKVGKIRDQTVHVGPSLDVILRLQRDRARQAAEARAKEAEAPIE